MQHNRSTPRSVATARAARAQAPAFEMFVRAALLAAAALILLAVTAMRAAAAPLRTTPAVLHSADSTPVPAELAAAPNPRLTADEVVEIVLDALARNDVPVKDHGIEVTFAFSSPANRAFVGPLDSFADLVRDDTYRPLLNHRHAARGVAHITGDRATERVVVTTASGEKVAYLFALSMQTDGEYKGCWMTDGVTREPPSPLQGMRFASRGTTEHAGRS
jgi:hypothetical protein